MTPGQQGQRFFLPLLLQALGEWSRSSIATIAPQFQQSQFLSVTTDKTQMQTDQKGHTKEGAWNVQSQHHRFNSICGCLAGSWAKKIF